MGERRGGLSETRKITYQVECKFKRHVTRQTTDQVIRFGRGRLKVCNIDNRRAEAMASDSGTLFRCVHASL